MTDHELLLAIYNNVQSVSNEVQSISNEVQSVKDDLENVKKDVKHLKKDVKHLKKEAIKMQAMDEAILDEVERVHGILDKHKADKTVHTA